MPFNPDIHRRRSIRLKHYDYTQLGIYFVTICAWRKERLFGEVVDGGMVLNELGTVAAAAWKDLPEHYRHVELDAFVIMPDHVHGLIVLHDRQDITRHGLPELFAGSKHIPADASILSAVVKAALSGNEPTTTALSGTKMN